MGVEGQSDWTVEHTAHMGNECIDGAEQHKDHVILVARVSIVHLIDDLSL